MKKAYTEKMLKNMDKHELCAICNNVEIADTTKGTAKRILSDKLAADNKAAKASFAEAAARKNDILHFIDHQFCRVEKLAENNNTLSIVDGTARISLKTVDKALCKIKKDQDGKAIKASIAADRDYDMLIAKFTDNLAKHFGEKLSAEENKSAHIGTLRYPDMNGKRKEYDFTGTNEKALYSQLDAIFVFIAGAAAKLHPTKASLAFVLIGAAQVVKNKNAAVKVSKERAILALVMNAMAARRADKGFTVETGVKEAKDAEAIKMAEEAISRTAPRTPNAFTGKTQEGRQETEEAEKAIASAKKVNVKPAAKKIIAA